MQLVHLNNYKRLLVHKEKGTTFFWRVIYVCKTTKTRYGGRKKSKKNQPKYYSRIKNERKKT